VRIMFGFLSFVGVVDHISITVSNM
jgi:hypothetical protein